MTVADSHPNSGNESADGHSHANCHSDEGAADANWQPSQEAITMDNASGTTLYMRGRDGAGNESEPFTLEQTTLYLPLVIR